MYRGYRYDRETWLYYLNSRYYNPEWGRFINADATGGKEGTLLSHNVFAYCFNNPVNLEDAIGYWPKWATVAVIAVAVVAVAVVAIAAPAVIPAIATAVSNAYYAAGAAVTVASWRAMDAVSKVVRGTPVSAAGNTSGIIAKTGTKVNGFVKHGVNRVIGDGYKRAGVKPQAILDAIKNPLKINPVKFDDLERPSQRLIGKFAEVVLNPNSGKIISVNPTSSSKAARLLKLFPEE